MDCSAGKKGGRFGESKFCILLLTNYHAELRVAKTIRVNPSQSCASAVKFAFMIDFDARLYKLVDAALQEDVGDGDHSTLCCIPADVKGKAVLKIKQDGILAGVDIAEKIFKYNACTTLIAY